MTPKRRGLHSPAEKSIKSLFMYQEHYIACSLAEQLKYKYVISQVSSLAINKVFQTSSTSTSFG
jgi:hypothetical protein